MQSRIILTMSNAFAVKYETAAADAKRVAHLHTRISPTIINVHNFLRVAAERLFKECENDPAKLLKLMDENRAALVSPGRPSDAPPPPKPFKLKALRSDMGTPAGMEKPK